MRDATADEIAFYQDNGYVAIEDFLTPDELAEWRDAVDEAVGARTTRLPTGELGGARPSDRRTYYDQVFNQKVNLWKTNERMRRLVLDPRMGKFACDLARIEGIRLWHDQALIKPPFGNPTAFHLDVPYWSFDSRDTLSAWIALDEATLLNGAMGYVPGSHKTARFENVGIGPELGALFDVYPEWRETAPEFRPVPAGACIYHNGLTAHGAGANMTPGYRRAMTCQYMPDGSTFNGKQNILSNEQIARLQVGDLLDDEDQNPLIWSYARDSAKAHARSAR